MHDFGAWPTQLPSCLACFSQGREWWLAGFGQHMQAELNA
jgi:hypothetical protein